MTKVADEVVAKFARQQHDWMERVLKGSLDPEEVARAVQTIINRGQKLFDEAAYFQNRPDLLVCRDLERFIGFTTKPARSLDSLTSYMLECNTSEADVFGAPGSDKRTEIMAGTTDLNQIAALIDLQSGGIAGKLLNDGRANIFAVIGKNGERYVVNVHWMAAYHRWGVFCHPRDHWRIWEGGLQVFSNLL